MTKSLISKPQDREKRALPRRRSSQALVSQKRTIREGQGFVWHDEHGLEALVGTLSGGTLTITIRSLGEHHNDLAPFEVLSEIDHRLLTIEPSRRS